MVYSIRFTIDTWLKQSTAQGASLPEDERQFIDARTILPLSGFSLEGTHLKFTLGKDDQGNQVFFKGRNTWYVYEPAVDVLQNGQPINPETRQAFAPAYILRIDLDTWLKQSTAQSSSLSDDQKQFVITGTQFPIVSFATAGKYHLKVVFGLDEWGRQVTLKGRNTWYVYAPAVEVLRDGEPFDVPGPLPPTRVYTLNVLASTWLKLSTAQSSTLPDSQKQVVRGGTTWPIYNFEPVGKYHLKVSFGLDERGKQVHFKGRTTWFVYRPAVEIQKNGEAIDLFPPTLPESSSPYVLDFNFDTWLKLSTAQSSSLPDSQRVRIQSGTQLPLASFNGAGSHLQVALGKDARGNQIYFRGRNTWYVYEPAIQVLQDGRPVDLSVLAPPEPVAPITPPSSSGGSTDRINADGLHLLKSFESLELDAYLDPVGVWTIGYGTTMIDGQPVYRGLRITEAEAEALLQTDLNRFESAVRNGVTININSNQFSALVSFTYNVGSGAFQGSTLRRLLNQNDILGAADELLKWVHGGGGVLPGLVRRRDAERALFLSQDYTVYL